MLCREELFDGFTICLRKLFQIDTPFTFDAGTRQAKSAKATHPFDLYFVGHKPTFFHPASTAADTFLFFANSCVATWRVRLANCFIVMFGCAPD